MRPLDHAYDMLGYGKQSSIVGATRFVLPPLSDQGEDAAAAVGNRTCVMNCGTHPSPRARMVSLGCVFILDRRTDGVGRGPVNAEPPSGTRPFTGAFRSDTNGDIMIRGDTLLTCRPDSTSWVSSGTGAGCAAVQDGTSSGHDSYFDMTYVDIDSDDGTFNSSSATVTIPDEATVLYAGLSWAGRTSAGSLTVDDHAYLQGAEAPAPESIGFASFKVPGDVDYSPVRSATTDVIGPNYQAYIDVTNQVARAGSGVYTVADVQAGTGGNSYAGWSLTIAYSLETLPARHLEVFTGYGAVSDDAPRDFTVSGSPHPRPATPSPGWAWSATTGTTPPVAALFPSTGRRCPTPSTARRRVQLVVDRSEHGGHRHFAFVPESARCRHRPIRRVGDTARFHDQ